MTLPMMFLGFAAVCLGVFLWSMFKSVRDLVVAPPPAASDAVSDARRRLLEEKAALLRSIKDLEFDREAGKLGEADFEDINRRLRTRAKEVLRLLDAEIEPYAKEAKRLIDAHLSGVKVPEKASAPVSSEAAEEKAGDSSAPIDSVTCPECDTTNDADASFCKRCATKLGGGGREDVTDEASEEDEERDA